LRKKLRKSEEGSLTVWLVGITPVLVILLMLFVNTILLIDSKIRLQAAIDRGVYAGSAHLAHVMNEIAGLNWKFRKEYLNKKKTFTDYSMDNSGWIQDQVDEMKHNQATHLEGMNDLLAKGYANAHQIAADIVRVNIEKMPHLYGSSYVSEYGSDKMFEMIDDYADGQYVSKEKIIPHEIRGISYDPKEYKKYEYLVRKYLIKSPENYVALAGSIRSHFMPPFLSKYFTDSKTTHLGAIAASQPYGGSVKEHALSGGDEQHLYHPAFIPVKLLVEEADVEH
jgi:hypothetical protein